MITGWRPTDDLFHDGLSLHNYCKMALPERLLEILDFSLLEEIGEIRQTLNVSQTLKERYVSDWFHSIKLELHALWKHLVKK